MPRQHPGCQASRGRQRLGESRECVGVASTRAGEKRLGLSLEMFDVGTCGKGLHRNLRALHADDPQLGCTKA